MELKQIKKFLDSPSGASLKQYLQLRLGELKDIDNVKDIADPKNQAIEVKAQKRAYSKLKEILQDIMTFSEPVRKKDPRDSYDIQ